MKADARHFDGGTWCEKIRILFVANGCVRPFVAGSPSGAEMRRETAIVVGHKDVDGGI